MVPSRLSLFWGLAPIALLSVSAPMPVVSQPFSAQARPCPAASRVPEPYRAHEVARRDRDRGERLRVRGHAGFACEPDLVVPQVSITSRTGRVTSGSVEVRFEATDDVALDAFAVTLDGVDVSARFTSTPHRSGRMTVRGTLALAPDRSQRLLVRVWDAAGNQAQGRATLAYDVSGRMLEVQAGSYGSDAPASMSIGGGPAPGAHTPNAGVTLARNLCLTVQAGSGAAYECGDLRLAHALPAMRTFNRARAPTLLYNSQHAHPHPLVTAHVTPSAAAGQPDFVSAMLSVAGVQRATGSWTGAYFTPGAASQIVLGFDALDLETGVYPYTLEVAAWYGGVGHPIQVEGELAVVNRSASRFGAGWWLAGWERLTYLGGNRHLWVGGDGSTRIYTSPDWLTWTAPAVDRPDTMTFGWDAEMQGYHYTRHLRGGAKVIFNAPGSHVATDDRLGRRTWFANDGVTGALTVVMVPAAQRSWTYDYAYLFEYGSPGGRLSAVTAYTGGVVRTTRITCCTVQGQVTAITDPDTSIVSFGYQGSGTAGLRVSARTDRRGTQVGYGYGLAGRLAQVQLHMQGTGSDIVTRFYPQETRGLPGTDVVRLDSAFTLIDGPRTDVADHMRLWLDRWGGPVRVRNALGHETSMVRDVAFPGLVAETESPNGLRSRGWYNARGLPDSTTVFDPLGDGRNATTRYRYDAVCHDFVREIVAPMGELTRIGYDGGPACNRTWQEDGRGPGSRTEFRYYSSGSHAGMLRAVDGPLTLPDSIIYDALANLEAVESASGARTTYVNDAVGRPHETVTRVTATTVLRQRSWYDLMDRDTLSITYGDVQEGNLEVRNRFDREGNLLRVARRTDHPSDSIGWLTTHWRYDRAGRVVAEIPSDSIWTRRGTEIQCSGPPENEICKPVSVVIPYPVKDSTTYDPAGNPVRTHTRRGHTIRMEYDALNRLTRRIIPDVRYPKVREATAFTSPHSVFRDFPYYSDQSDGSLLIRGDTETFAYDDATTRTGQVVLASNRDAVVRRSYHRNGLVRGDTLHVSPWEGVDYGQHVYGLELGYDLNGRRTSLLHPHVIAPRTYGSTTALRNQSYSYHPLTGQLESITNPMGSVYTYGYDLEGRLERLDYPGGIYEVLHYDGFGRLDRREHRAPNYAGGPRALHDDSYVYDLRGKQTAVLVSRTGGQPQQITLNYSLLGSLLSSNEHVGKPGDFRQERFTVDALGNALWTEVSPGLTGWRLTGHVHQPATGRRYRSMESDGGAIVGGDTIVAYDESGNQHRQSSFRGTGIGWTYRSSTFSYYGADQRLRVVDRWTCRPNGRENQPSTACLPPAETELAEGPGVFEEYRYDALGRRVALRTRREHECLGNGCSSGVQRIVWDGDQILYEIRARGHHGATTAEMENDTTTVWGPLESAYGRVLYTHGPGIDQPLSLVRMGYTWGDGSRPASRPLAGAHEIVLSSNWRGSYDGGSIPDGSGRLPFASDQYGTLTMNIAWPAENHRAFLGQRAAAQWKSWMGSQLDQMRDASGLLYRRNRYYDPVSGRFTQEDPIGIAGGLNVYGYAHGDPISYLDPYGLCPENDRSDCTALVARLRSQRGSAFRSAANTLESSGYAVHIVSGDHERLYSPDNDNRDGNPRTFVAGLVNRGRREMYLNGDLSEPDLLLTAVHEVDHVTGGDEASATLAGWRAFLQMTPTQQNAAPRNQFYFFQMFRGAETGFGSNTLINSVREPRRCGMNDIGCPQAY